MKIISYFIVLLAFISCTSCTGAEPVNVAIQVVDQDGIPVEGVAVGVGFRTLGGKDNSDKGLTNTQGIYVAKGRSNYEFVAQVSKRDYYPSKIGWMSVKREVKPTQWEVVDQNVTVTLRKIKDPIPMYAKKGSIIIPEKGKEVGFDFEAGDWVTPYGRGKKEDILFFVDGYFKNSNDTQSELKIKFPNPDDGFVLLGSGVEESEFKSPYQAPLSDYESEIEGKQGMFVDANEKLFQTYEPVGNPVMAFRLRTKLDENGEVISARYGKIYGGFDFGGAASPEGYFVKFTYYLNPTMNDRNLEYAVGENLVKPLKKSYQPKMP